MIPAMLRMCMTFQAPIPNAMVMPELRIHDWKDSPCWLPGLLKY